MSQRSHLVIADALSVGVKANLTAGISATDASFTLESGTGFGTSDFDVVIENEIITVGSRSGAVCSSLTRGVAGTMAAPHNRGDSVAEIVNADTVSAAVEGGGSQSGAATVRGPFSFTFDTVGLVDGVAFGWTPAANDVLVDAWFEVDEAWDGTTPTADIGPFTDLTYGVFAQAEAVNLAVADVGAAFDSMSQSSETASTPSLAGTGLASLVQKRKRHAPGSVYVSEPWKVVVSQDGTKGGADPGSAQGAARLYIVTATPAAF